MSEAHAYDESAYSAPQAEDEFPQSVEAEQALLGAILLNNDAYDGVAEFLEPEHFYEPLHARIYHTIQTKSAAGEKATPVTIHHLFGGDEALEQVGGGKYLAGLAVAATTILNVPGDGRTTFDFANRHAINHASQQMTERARPATGEDTPQKPPGAAGSHLWSTSGDKVTARSGTTGDALGECLAGAAPT